MIIGVSPYSVPCDQLIKVYLPRFSSVKLLFSFLLLIITFWGVILKFYQYTIAPFLIKLAIYMCSSPLSTVLLSVICYQHSIMVQKQMIFFVMCQQKVKSSQMLCHNA